MSGGSVVELVLAATASSGTAARAKAAVGEAASVVAEVARQTWGAA